MDSQKLAHEHQRAEVENYYREERESNHYDHNRGE